MLTGVLWYTSGTNIIAALALFVGHTMIPTSTQEIAIDSASPRPNTS